MVVSPVTEHDFTATQLAHWGLLRRAQREELIDQCVEEAAPPSNEQLQTLLQHWCTQNKLTSAESLQNWQHHQGLSPHDWQELVARSWRWGQWCLQHFDPQLSSYYLKRKPQLDQVSYSLLRVSQRPLANELYLRIKERESSFEDVAGQYSEGPERASGGRLGPVPLHQPHPVLARLLQVSSPGQLWPPKQLESWWIVVRMDHLHATELTDETAQQLALELGEQHLEQILDLSP